jgi:two-component system, NarL family, response regulator DevR
MRVVIVEDSPLVVERLLSVFTEFGGDIDVVGHADEAAGAIVVIRALRPDAIVLDIRLRRGTGLEVLEAVKGDGEPPIVMILTNRREPQYRGRCLAAGADYFLDKSAEFDCVRTVFESLVAGAPA